MLFRSDQVSSNRPANPLSQAFHWVGHDGASSTAEIARVLRPGGSLVLIWNLEDRSTPWVAQCRDAYERFEAGTPQCVLCSSIEHD